MRAHGTIAAAASVTGAARAQGSRERREEHELGGEGAGERAILHVAANTGGERVKAVGGASTRTRAHARAQAACAYTLVPLKLPSQSVGSAEQIVAVSATGSSSVQTSADHRVFR